MLPKLAVTREGSTELFVPVRSLRARTPQTYPAFFNPAARLNRDISVAIARATRPSNFLDALAGVGARGIRVATEASRTVRVTLVEFNKTSLEIAKKNVRRNQVGARCELVHEESNAYLHSRFGRLERFSAVDLDPFGSPAPYTQGALNAAGEGALVSITATDTATLCGVYPEVAWRRYGARVQRSEFGHEAAVRVLLGFIARVGGVVDVGIRPVAAHATLHYLRVYFRALRGAAMAERSLQELGYVSTCATCHDNSVAQTAAERCPRCGGRVFAMGPQWVGKLVDEELRAAAYEESMKIGLEVGAKALDALKGCDEFPPFGYRIDRITSREKLSSVPLQGIIDGLKAVGRSAMRQSFGSSGLKTDASYREVLEAVRGAARRASAASTQD